MPVAVPQQPDISYHPDFEKYKRRRDRLQASRLPAGFPARLTGPLVWEGKDFPREEEWTFALNQAQLSEIDAALLHFKALQKPIGHVSQETFPLTTLKPLLRKEAHELYTGRGFFVLRGLQVDKYSREDNIIIYVGVSSYIGNRGRQGGKQIIGGEQKSNALLHIKDLSKTAEEGKIGAPAYTTDRQVFHTDIGDIVSLFCFSPAASGGESQLASSWRVYNELAETRPDLIETLATNWAFDNLGYGPKDKPYTLKPLLFHTPAKGSTPERVVIQYARRNFTGFLHQPRASGIPPITEEQAEALDTLHFLAERFALTLDFQKGDVQYINNLSIFHAREAFIDTPEKQRHLVRLWLRDPELSWETHEGLKELWDSLYADVTEEEQQFPLDPDVRG